MSNCMTMAVDDSDRHAPSTIDAAGELPNCHATAPITEAEITICKLPRPNTRRRICQSRSSDSSSPIMNSRKITPSSASACTPARSEITAKRSHAT
jgi:hypothetical protein